MVGSSREKRHDAFRRRSVSDEPRLHPLEPGNGKAQLIPDEDLFPVTSAPILGFPYEQEEYSPPFDSGRYHDEHPLFDSGRHHRTYEEEDSPPFNGNRIYQRTEVSVEIHREPSNGSGSSKGDLAMCSRTASPPKLLETCTRAQSRTRHSVSLETVSPTERLAVTLEKRRVKSCESDLHEYDRLEITQFHRGPFYNADYDVMSEGGSPELRSKVRYNDTGSFEEVDEEHVQLLDITHDISSVDDVTMEDDDDTETLNGAQKYRELWNLRATFEEEEDFSDTIRMEDLTSPDEQSPEEQEQATTSELTTSFESNTDPVAEQDEGPPHDQGDGECHGDQCPGPSGEQRRKSSTTLLIPQLSYESRRQNYRGILTKRSGKKVEMPTTTNDNSFDSIETMDTDGDISEDTSRHGHTTSFESTTDNTDSTGEPQKDKDHKLQQMRGDSGYKSLETQQTLPGSSPPGPTPTHKAVAPRKQIQFVIEADEVLGAECKEMPLIKDKPTATSPTAAEGLHRSASQKNRDKSSFERRTAKTASKKRREYGRERQVVQILGSLANEGETDSRSDQLSGDSFDDGNVPPGNGGKFSVFTRFFKSQRKSSLSRDFSIDEKTDAIFQQFTRHDPNMDMSKLQVRRPSYSRQKLHRKTQSQEPPETEQIRHKLGPEMRSVSMGSDSSAGSIDRRLFKQESTEGEEYHVPSREKVEEWNTEVHSLSPTPRKDSVIHDIPIIKLPEGETGDMC